MVKRPGLAALNALGVALNAVWAATGSASGSLIHVALAAFHAVWVADAVMRSDEDDEDDQEDEDEA